MYLNELRSQVDGAQPVAQAGETVQGFRPFRLWHFLLTLQLLTGVFHQLHLQGTQEAE